jgi:hypothetical protein
MSSYIVSPKTGKLIKTGSGEFQELTQDPVWKGHFTSPLDPSEYGIKWGRGIPVNGQHFTQPRLPILPTTFTPFPAISNNHSRVGASLMDGVIPMSPEVTGTLSPRLHSVNVRKEKSLLDGLRPLSVNPTNVRAETTKSLLNGLRPMSPEVSSLLSPRSTFKPLSVNPTTNVRTTTTKSLLYGLRPLSPISPAVPTVPALPSFAPTTPISVRSPLMEGVRPLSYLPHVTVPTVAPAPIMAPMPAVPAPVQMEKIMAMPIYPIPTLEETLAKTRQPFLKESLKEMIATGKEEEGRGIKTRSWRARAPKKGRDRHQLMAECGPSCFLKPETEGFPICPKCEMGNGKCICEIDCAGVQSAKIRAAQWKYPEVEAKADQILREKCTHLSYFTPRK